MSCENCGYDSTEHESREPHITEVCMKCGQKLDAPVQTRAYPPSTPGHDEYLAKEPNKPVREEPKTRKTLLD